MKKTILVLKKNYNIALFVVILIFGFLTSFYQYKSINNIFNKNILKQNDYIHNSFEVFLNKLKDDLDFKSDNLINIPNLKESFSNLDRDGVYSLIKDHYKRILISNKHLKIITFRLNDGSTFLRVHKPEMFGDKLNKKRKIILDSIETKTKQFGFEVGKLKMTYRVVTPIIFKNKLIGVMEVGVEPEYITDQLASIYDIKMALLIKKDQLSINIAKATTQNNINGFIFARGDELFTNKIKDISFKDNLNKISYKKSDYFINTNLNLNDNKNNIAAKVLIAYNLDYHNQELKNMIKVNLFITIMLFIILILFFNYFIKRTRTYYEEIVKKDKVMSIHSKNAAMGEMIGNIAHQWRQPLSIISTAATGLKIKKESDILEENDIYKMCDMINDNAQYLSATIDDFKNFIKGDRKKVKFNLSNDIRSFIHLVEGSIKNENIEIIFDLDESIEMDGYPNELIQCFINIFNNSKDALNEKNTEKYFFINTFSDNGIVNIVFKDNGGGVDKDITNRLFEPYFTTKHQSKGTGLGLSMTYNIINEGMSGNIEIKNVTFKLNKKEYKGLEVKISLPLKDD